MHKVLEFGRIGVAQALGKSLTKAEAYRACFKDFLLNNRDATKAKALGSVLTSQEWRYFKQAFYLTHRHVAQEIGPLASISSSVVSNFSCVRRAYEEALQTRRADRSSR